MASISLFSPHPRRIDSLPMHPPQSTSVDLRLVHSIADSPSSHPPFPSIGIYTVFGLAEPEATPRSHAPMWECRLARSAGAFSRLEETKSVGDGIPALCVSSKGGNAAAKPPRPQRMRDAGF